MRKASQLACRPHPSPVWDHVAAICPFDTPDRNTAKGTNGDLIKITQTSLQSPSLKYSQSHFLKKEQAGNQSVLLKIKANRPGTLPRVERQERRGRPRPYTSHSQSSGLSKAGSEEAEAEVPEHS